MSQSDGYAHIKKCKGSFRLSQPNHLLCEATDHRHPKLQRYAGKFSCYMKYGANRKKNCQKEIETKGSYGKKFRVKRV